MPIEQVQVLLGHSQIDTTLRYAMVNQNNVKVSHHKYIADSNPNLPKLFDLENLFWMKTTSKYKLMAIGSICEDGEVELLVMIIL